MSGRINPGPGDWNRTLGTVVKKVRNIPDEPKDEDHLVFNVGMKGPTEWVLKHNFERDELGHKFHRRKRRDGTDDEDEEDKGEEGEDAQLLHRPSTAGSGCSSGPGGVGEIIHCSPLLDDEEEEGEEVRDEGVVEGDGEVEVLSGVEQPREIRAEEEGNEGDDENQTEDEEEDSSGTRKSPVEITLQPQEEKKAPEVSLVNCLFVSPVDSGEVSLSPVSSDSEDFDNVNDTENQFVESNDPVSARNSSSMIIEDAEKLRSWLTAILQPLCDADPAALAKYVLALIKKDKPERDLRQSMSDQLDVFLQKETSPFIDRLFELLTTREYMTSAPPAIPPKESNEGAAGSDSQGTYTVSSTSSSGSSSKDTVVSVSSGMSVSSVDQLDSASNQGEPMSLDEAEGSKKDASGKNNGKDVRKEDDRERGRRRRSRSPARRRGRSRSRGRDKKYHPRKNWRSGRRSRSRSPFRSNSLGRNRSRSPFRYRRHGTNGSRSRSRSRSPKMGVTMGGSPVEVSLKDTEKPSVQSVVVKAGSSGGEKGGRCRDFDEKGLCMRGELCPFDHGTDPVVLEDIVIPGVTPASTQYNQGGIGGPDAFGAGIVRPGIGPVMGEYYPDNPGMDPSWGQFRPRMGYEPAMMRGRPMMGPRHMGPYHHPPGPHRDLISVPVMGMPMDDIPPPMGMHPRGMYNGRGRGRGFDHSRLGYKPQRNYANCSLEVKKIPREQNNIMDLNSHFQKFGKIVNIQIQFDGDPEAALVTFSAPVEAQTAYRSTEAVLNNRFIRVFWHTKEKENEEGVAENEFDRIPIKERLGGIQGEDDENSQEKVLVSGNNITKTVYNPGLLAKKTDTAAEKQQAVEAIKKSQEMLAAQESLKRKQEEKKKEAMKIISDLRKRKQEMLDEQLQAQKKLISKLETKKSTMKPEEIQDCMNVIKTIQIQIEKIKKDLEDTAPKAVVRQPPKSKEEAEREMLDAELELYNREQEGGDTLALQRKISELRASARQLGVPSPRGRGGFRGSARGGFRGRGARHLRSLRTVDRRPTRLRVAGFPVARLPEILPHFSQFGTVIEYETDTVTPSMVLNFDNRKSAEMAMSNGKLFGESELEISWVANPNTEGPPSQSPTGNGGGSQEHAENGNAMEEDELGDILANEILLTYEEDEDDDEANRSWRR